MTDPLLLLLLPPAILIGWLYRVHLKQQKIERDQARARREAEQGLVPCFTCGMKIPREGALEKKGRYFCGIKKAEREAAGHTPDHSSSSTGP